ncbi:PAS domain S-box protein [Gemmata sp. JC717]|uniref:hybrid sensor histidine kinase/response regulator n=1 Tax=Gemmata algarum TaxID=2975278 RepID=UPI0021BB5CF8|nr:PAS domain-containing sensor histidine kinase [Gemmata algarum]MDY3555235.1 PAS domain S-box protein [Gemmata algarum]
MQTDLRHLAEQLLRDGTVAAPDLNGIDLDGLVHELYVYHAELVVQKSELEAAQAQAERSRNEYAQLFHYAPASILFLDRRGVIREANQTAARALGADAGAVRGKPFTAFLAGGEHAAFHRHLKSVLGAGHRAEFPARCVRPGGGGFPAEVVLEWWPMSEPGEPRAAAAVRDVSDRAAAEAAGRAAAEAERRAWEQTRATLDALPAQIALLDPAGAIVAVNAAWRRSAADGDIGAPYLGVRARIWTGTRAADERHVGDGLGAVLAGTAAEFVCEYLYGTHQGPRWCRLVVTPVRTDRVTGAAVTHIDVTERKAAEQALRFRERAITSTAQGFVICDFLAPDRPLTYVSPGFERITGWAAGDAIGRNCRFLQGRDTDRAAVDRLRAAQAAGEACAVELLNYRRDGSPFWNGVSVSPVRDEAGRVTHYVGVLSDVTARRQLDEQSRQGQKMEAIGRLASGVAHDFNNLLTVINGYTEILLSELPPGGRAHQLLREVWDAGERSAGLTRQLLSFSHKQVLRPQDLDLNAAVAGAESLLRRLIGEHIRLVTWPGADAGAAHADAGQFQQVLMNLSINARDAMPAGGQLTIRTGAFDLGADHPRARLGAPPGRYATLSVSDTGCGMSAEVKDHLFEPFFTTKGVGKGTGLGLATVFGVVQSNGGWVEVESEPGAGTTVCVYLPQVAAPPPPPPEPPPARPPRGAETILLVEDEDGVRALSRCVLAACGYTVLEACDGEEALRLARAQGPSIQLLLTDVVMPGPSGREVAEEIRGRHPATKVLFVSGYTDDAVVTRGVFQDRMHFLHKPFSPHALALKVREVLDAP